MFISIVIPCHNCVQTIDRAVNSVLSQTHKEWELILVNNNSVDHTWEKLNEIKKQHPEKAITILNEDKKGAPTARNKGLYVAKGEWIQFLDSDDELLPEKIEKQIKLYGDSDLIIGGAISQTFDGHQEIRKLNHDVWIGLIKSELGITTANLFRKNKLLEVDGWKESLTSSQEYDLMFRMLSKNALVSFLTDSDCVIYENEASISRDKSSFRIQQIVKNRLDLRFSIAAYLKKENKLTHPIKIAIKESVMNNLLFYGNDIPLYSWKTFLQNISLLNPKLKDFKHLLMITLFYTKK